MSERAMTVAEFDLYIANLKAAKKIPATQPKKNLKKKVTSVPKPRKWHLSKRKPKSISAKKAQYIAAMSSERSLDREMDYAIRKDWR
jgi:hypothetical protein